MYGAYLLKVISLHGRLCLSYCDFNNPRHIDLSPKSVTKIENQMQVMQKESMGEDLKIWMWASKLLPLYIVIFIDKSYCILNHPKCVWQNILNSHFNVNKLLLHFLQN